MAGRRIRRIRSFYGAAPLVVAAAVAYPPLILSSPGKVGADTKTYLYLDPSRLLADASSLWDSDVAMGTVTHQTIGYLWPMGPFYWLAETLQSPDWLAQRLWIGSILFGAAAGVRYLLKTLDWKGGGLLVAMLAYELSPYALHYSARISVVLLPWAGLPWMVALTIRAARQGGWRHPAQFALLAVTVGSVNATSLLFVGLAPVLWLLHAAGIERSISATRALVAALRIAVTTVAVSLWWIAGLAVQGAYSLPVTRYTETYEVVADAATGPEVFRGLGYWFFYGNDKFGQWIEPSIEYTQGVWLHFLSFGLVVFALAGSALIRWRHRSYFVLLIVVGGLAAIASHPFDSPSALGSAFKSLTETDVGLALRSTPRALPLLVLGTAVSLGMIANATQRRWPDQGRVLAVLICAAVVLNNPAMWRIRMIEEHLHRDEQIPQYWIEAISALDNSGNDGRVLEVPGTDFASYRWGNTVDPITPGLLDRGYIARELVPFGSAESAALLTAFDRRFQENSLDLDSVVPVAKLMSVDDVVHRGDLTFERFRTPRPVVLADQLARAPGLGPGAGFGEPRPNVAGPEQTMLDEVHLGIDPTLADPAPVTVYPVPDALDIVRLRPLTGGTVIAGDAEGLVDLAGAGLLDLDRTVWFAADLVADEDLRSTVLAEPSRIVITDANARRARRWGTLRENRGAVERSGEVPLADDPTDNRLELFGALEQRSDLEADDSRTVAVQEGDFTVQASAYGNPVTYTNDDRAFFAVDGDLDTAWVVAAFAEARGEFLEFDFDSATQVSEMTFVQPQNAANRHITEVEIRADGPSFENLLLGRFTLGPQSRSLAGQRVEFAETTASKLRVEITDLDFGVHATYPGVSPVGFAEVLIGPSPQPLRETIRTPVALVEALGSRLDVHDLSVVLTRERSDPKEPVREDPEAELHRWVPMTAGRGFGISGSARLSATAPESQIDFLLGRSETPDGLPITARSSGRLPGDLKSAASFAFDNDPDTAWRGVFGSQAGQWLEFEMAEPVHVERLVIDVVADDLHSLPRRILVRLDGEEAGELAIDGGLRSGPRGQTVRLELGLDRAFSTLVLVAAEVDERVTRDWYSNAGVAMPIAVAEVDLGDGVHFSEATGVDTGCRELLVINGAAVGARVRGSAEDALSRRELALVGCDETVSAAGGLRIESKFRSEGLDLDQLVLRSPRPTTPPPPVAPVVVLSEDDASYTLSVEALSEDHWLVLGQSHNGGWSASVDGVDLGAPVLLDGFANGWRLPAGDDRVVELRWTPQRLVDWALWLSLASALVVGLLAVRSARRPDTSVVRRRDGPDLPVIDPAVAGSTSARPAPPGSGRRVGFGFVLAFGFALANLPQWHMAAVVVGAVAALGVWSPRWWNRPALYAALLLGLAAVSIMVEQRRFRHPPDFVWPQQFENVHILAVLALLLLFADYLRSAHRPDA
ncbi:MAG: alpha-(1-_3)-arabinofuranosyltransferase family protein [Acidimicrobiaceae bacterium]|nr:alpha-(1->3)-arabinofuranosyltransferase family protein [Acidimicrobiaceae bacterium]